MATCLGLYVEDNIIKYAKVSKDNDNFKIDSFGIKFYDNINEAISQVIEETYSYNTPISINLSGEMYNYFYLFSALNKKDMQNVINTEFESICYDKNINKDAFETRYVLVNEIEDKEKIKAIHVAASKADIAKKTQQLEGYKVSTASPIGLAIGNLIESNDNENIMIVNIEENTTITTIVDKKITDVQKLEEGASQILNAINARENSYLKSYEICKNTTIYTAEGSDLQYENNEYLDLIMPVLYNIVENVRKLTSESLNGIDKIYITGTASVINNIDIYFQEYLGDIKCEILRPFFINNSQAKINIKDYIEVNTPIALALQGLDQGIKGINFKKETFKDKIPNWMNIEIGNKKEKSKSKKLNINFDLSGKLTHLEHVLLTTAVGLFLLIVVYSGASIYLNNAMNKKEEEINSATSDVNSQISLIQKDIKDVKTLTSSYISKSEKLDDLNNKRTEKNKRKNSIPTLLNQIMFSIPKQVQITSIENTSGDRIVIKAQAKTYEQLGFLKAKLKEDGILINIVSDSGQKQEQNGLVLTTIEGDLPI